MPGADVVVIGAGLSGLTTALAAARSGARVQVLAKGHAATHWGTGGFDIAAIPDAATPRAGLRKLAAKRGHPYANLVGDVEPALAWLLPLLAAEGLTYEGDLDSALSIVPTSIGGTRRAAILPSAQAAALRPWEAGERLVICGVAGFKDFWPDAIAAGLSRHELWGDSRGPDRVEAVSVELPDLAGRHNLSAVELARRFDDAAWRARAIDLISSALSARGPSTDGGPGRVALPAILGLDDHAAALDELRRRLPLEPFELPLVPPSVPGMRLYRALRSALIKAGGRIQIGEMIDHVDRDGSRLTAVATEAAARTNTTRAGAVVLATGGLAGGGIVADHTGHLEEVVLGLPVEAPEFVDWLSADAFDPAGHPLEGAGVRTDSDLRPVDTSGKPVFENARVVGASLAGQRYLRERCRDGVDIASGWRAGNSLAAGLAAGAGAAANSATNYAGTGTRAEQARVEEARSVRP
jgi:glycerol-3-phosphate dehydrogenase subunit B